MKDEVSHTLEGLDEDAEVIRQDDKAFFKHVQEVAIANERSYLSQKKAKQSHSKNDPHSNPKSPERKNDKNEKGNKYISQDKDNNKQGKFEKQKFQKK